MDLEDFEMSKNVGIYVGGVGMVGVGLSGKDGSGGGSEFHATLRPFKVKKNASEGLVRLR